MNYKVELKIKDLLEQKNISQKRLAEIAGLRESTISDIVRGSRTVINFEHLSKIAEALDIQDISLLIDFASEQNEESIAWEQDIYECIKNIKKKSFTLQDAYGFINELQRKHPDCRNVDAKIRQGLQMLQKKGIIEFVDSKGQYKLL